MPGKSVWSRYSYTWVTLALFLVAQFWKPHAFQRRYDAVTVESGDLQLDVGGLVGDQPGDQHVGDDVVAIAAFDVIDAVTALQAVALVTLLSARQPRSLGICALLHKHIATELHHPVRFTGFDAPHEFLVGDGLDHAESFRHLPYIASLQ